MNTVDREGWDGMLRFPGMPPIRGVGPVITEVSAADMVHRAHSEPVPPRPALADVLADEAARLAHERALARYLEHDDQHGGDWPEDH